MLIHRFNPLRSQHEDTPPANPGTAAPTADPVLEKEAGEEQKDEEKEPETAPVVETPEAAAAVPKLTAFQRGSLRALGLAGLVDQVEVAKGETFIATAEVERLTAANNLLTAENIRLTGELAKLQKETPEKIEAAAKGREDEVSKKVTAELSGLGITAEAAPSQLTADEAEKTLSRADFDKLDHSARNKFFAQGGKLKD
jgi:hypothetical protein